jgi:hypothetical protein
VSTTAVVPVRFGSSSAPSLARMLSPATTPFPSASCENTGDHGMNGATVPTPPLVVVIAPPPWVADRL